MSDNLPPPRNDDEFDDLSDLDWLNSAEVTPPPDDDLDWLRDDASGSVYGDRDRDAGIGQAQYGRIAQRRIEDAIEKAEAAEFGDPKQMLDWLREPEATDEDLPDWLRTPDDPPPPSWLQGISFDTPNAPNTDWLKSVADRGTDVPLWSPPTGDTGHLIEQAEALQKVGTGDLPHDTGWLDNADFSGQKSTSPLKDKSSRYEPDAFGLSRVEPLRTEEAPALNPEDIFPQAELPPVEPAAEFAAAEESDWDELMALFPADPDPSTPPAPPLDLSAEFFDNLTPEEPAEDAPDLDLDALLAIDTPQPTSLGDQLTAEPDLDLDALLAVDLPDEAASTLPRRDFAPAPAQPEALDAAMPDWMLEADPFAEANPDWLSEFEQPRISEDPLAGLELPVSSRDVGEKPSGGDEVSFEALVESLSDAPSDPHRELDELLAAMRTEHELGDGHITSYEDLFDSNLFDKSSIAELDDEVDIPRASGSLDDLFASGLFDTSEIAALDDSLPARADLSAIFDDQPDMIGDIPFPQPDAVVSDAGLQDWLRGAQASAGTSSLAAALRAQQDRPLAELDERLLALREDVLSVQPPDETAEGLIAEILPGVPEALAPAPLPSARPELTTSLNVTEAHLAQAALLAALASEQASPTAARERSTVRVPLVRLLVLALLAAAVILPLTTNVDLAPPPLAAFTGAREAAYVDTLNQLEHGDLVLVAIEYDATHAYELDALALATFNHLRLRGAHPVIISTNSVGILRTKQLLEQVFPDGANREYFLTRLIASGVVGLRDLANNATLLNLDANGAPNGLQISRLDDFAVGVLISSSVEVNRLYVEQVIPQMPRPFLLASTFAALPPSIAYYTAGRFDGVLAGYRDTVIYEAVLNAAVQPPADSALPVEVTPTVTPAEATTLSPTATPRPPTATPTPISTEEAPIVVPVELTATSTATLAAPTTTQTLPPATATTAPTEAAATPTAPLPTPTLTSAPLVLVGTIVANDAINVRANPSTSAPVLTTLRPGTVVRVLAFNADQTWVSVALPDNRVGWVAAFLIRVEERPITDTPFQRLPAFELGDQQATPEALIQVGTALRNEVSILGAPSSDAAVIGQMARGDQLRVLVVEGAYASVVLPDGRIGFVEVDALEVRTRREADAQALPAPGLTVLPPTPTPSPTRTPTPTPTLTPTPSPTPTAPTVALAVPPDQRATNGGERWQSQFFGVLAAFALILVGNLYYLLRAILYRRRRSA